MWPCISLPQLLPALSKWGGTTVGLTLLAIGFLGIYESFFEDHHHEHHHGVPGAEEASGQLTVASGGHENRRGWHCCLCGGTL